MPAVTTKDLCYLLLVLVIVLYLRRSTHRGLEEPWAPEGSYILLTDAVGNITRYSMDDLKSFVLKGDSDAYTRARDEAIQTATKKATKDIGDNKEAIRVLKKEMGAQLDEMRADIQAGKERATANHKILKRWFWELQNPPWAIMWNPDNDTQALP